MTEKKQKVLCAFDFDGTLVDSMHGFADIASEIIDREYQVGREKARQMYYDTSGLPFFQQLDMLFPGSQANPQLAEEFEQRKLDGFHSQDFFPDARATLEGLRSRGIKVAVCSNNFQENVDRFVADRDMLFDFVLGFRDGFSKGPGHFDFLLAQLGAGKPEMIFVGDSLKDAEKAVHYGIDFVGRTGTFSRDDFTSKFPQFPVIDELVQLLELV